MKGKPIEPGCLALIIRIKKCEENLGRTVRVLYKPGPLEPLPGHKSKIRAWNADTWFVEALPGHPDLATPVVEPMTRTYMRKDFMRVAAVREKNLIRIDDNDENLDRVVEQSKPVIKTKPVEEIF